MNNSSDLFDPEHADMDDIAPPIDFNAVNKGVDLHYEPIDDLLKGAVSIASASHHLMSCHDTYMEKEYINYDHFTNSKQVFLEDDCLSSSLFPSSSAVMIPAAPFVLLVTSFRCSMGNDELVEKISNILTAMEVSFEFSPNLAEFNAVYVNGSIYIKFQIHLYTETGSNVFGEEPSEKIVEAQRQIGDGFAFNSIFGEIRKGLLEKTETNELKAPTFASSSSPRLMRCDSFGTSSTSGRLTGSNALATSAYCSDDATTATNNTTDTLISPLSDEEKQRFVEPIKRMTDVSATIDSQLEGCRLICDMVSSDSNFREQLLSCGCVEILIRLALGKHFLTSQHAVIALVELSATPGCLKMIWDTIHVDGQYHEFIDFLCRQLVDGPYYSEAKRRQSANLLVNMLEYLMNACAADDDCTNDIALMKANIDKYQHHIEMINTKVVSPRSCRKPGDDMFAMSVGKEQHALSGLNFSQSVPISRQTSGTTDFFVKEEALHDKVLEKCINRIQTILEKDTEVEDIILDLDLDAPL